MKSGEIPKVYWTVDGRVIPIEDDWRASTIANGGYNTFSGRLSADTARKFDLGQGAPVAMFLESGDLRWEGRIGADPSLSAGYALLTANGYKELAEDRTGRLFYQSRDAGLMQDEGGNPYNASPDATISASSGPGFLLFSVAQGTTVTNNDSHGLCGWLQGSRARRIRGTIELVGDATSYQLSIDRFTGPSGTRTNVATPGITNGAAIDTGTITGAEDGIAVSLVCTSTHTSAAPLDVFIRDFRINDLNLADSMEASAVAADVARRCGFDVTGVPAGPGIDNAAARTVTYRSVWKSTYDRNVSHLPFLVRGLEMVSDEPAVVTSAINVLPIDWTSGSHAALLDYLSQALDWRWRVLSNAGNGPLFQFGPWEGAWEVDPAANAEPELTTRKRSNKAIVKYPNAAGNPAQVEAFADGNQGRPSDPFANRGLVYEWVETLSDNQPDDTLPKRIAQILIQRLPLGGKSGRIQITGAHDQTGAGDCYSVIAGEQVYEKSEGLTLRVTETEMTKDGTALGVEDHVSFASQQAALTSQARLRKPFGIVVRT